MIRRRGRRFGAGTWAVVVAACACGCPDRVDAATARTRGPDLRDGACIAVLAIDAEKAKPERRSTFEAGAFYFFGKLEARRAGRNLVKVIQAGSATVRDDSAAVRKRCYGEIGAVGRVLETVGKVFEHAD